MAMTIESIRKVSDERSYLLLIEPIFYLVGKKYQLLSMEEVKNQRIAATAGVDNEQLISEGGSVGLSIEKMVRLIKEEVPFELETYSDAKLIFECVDHFLGSQARLVNKRIGGIKDFMLDDFELLTKLANRMLEYIDIGDRIELMNAPKEAEKTYENIFDLMLNGLATQELSVQIEEAHLDDSGYSSPFQNLIKNRQNINRLHRW